MIFGLQDRLGRKILITNKAGRHAGLSCVKKIIGKSPQTPRSNKMWKKLILKQLSRTKRYVQNKSNCGEGFLCLFGICVPGCLFILGFFLRNIRTESVSNPFQISKYLHHGIQACTSLEL